MPIPFKVALDDSQFTAGMKRMERTAQKSTQTIGASLKSGIGDFGSGALGGFPLGMAAAGAAAIGFAKNTVDLAGQLADTASALNINVTALQAYQQAFSQSGASAENFRAGLGALSQAIATAMDDAASPAAQAFERMGIGQNKLASSTDDVSSLLPLLADGFKNASSSAQGYADIVTILGKGGKIMASGLREGAAGLEELRGKASVISAEDIKRMDDFGDSTERAFNKLRAWFVSGIGGLDAGGRKALQTIEDNKKAMEEFQKSRAPLVHKSPTEAQREEGIRALRERTEADAKKTADAVKEADKEVADNAKQQIGEIEKAESQLEAMRDAMRGKRIAKEQRARSVELEALRAQNAAQQTAFESAEQARQSLVESIMADPHHAAANSKRRARAQLKAEAVADRKLGTNRHDRELVRDALNIGKGQQQKLEATISDESFRRMIEAFEKVIAK